MFNFLKKHYRKRYHGIYQHAKKLFAFDLALLFITLVILGGNIFLFFWKPTLTNLIDLSISLGKEKIKSGEEVHLTIDYANKSKYKLNAVSLGLRLPDGFVIDKSKTPAAVFSSDSTFVSLKEINAGATGQAELYGWFWSEQNKETKFIANLSYQPENTNGREQKLSSFLANISESVLTGQLAISSSTLPNYPLKFTYTLQNSSDRAINNISVASNWSTNVINEADASNISLPPGGVKIIEGQLTTPNKSGNYNFSLTPQVLVNNHLVPQLASAQDFQIFSPQIISSARLLQNFDYAEPGQVIPVEIKWENQSGFKLQNITLHIASNLQGVVDWVKTAKANNAKPEQNGLFFDSASRTSLSNGNPDSADTFTIKVYLLPTFNLQQAERVNLEIYPIVKAMASEISGQEIGQEGARLRLPLATEVNFDNLEARYYTGEGDQLGRGPLPPTVGKTTKYWIFVKISNTTNALSDSAFTTSLPEGVEFTGKQSVTIGPQLIYNNSDRAVTWSYSSLPANSQTGLYFEVAVTPQNSQLGQNLQLTDSLRFTATDDFTNKKFDISHSPITNILNADDAGRSLGSKVR